MRYIFLLILCLAPLISQAQPFKPKIIKKAKGKISGRYFKPPLKVSRMPKILRQLNIRGIFTTTPVQNQTISPLVLERKVSQKTLTQETAPDVALKLQQKAIENNFARLTGGIDLLTYRDDLLNSYHLTRSYMEGFYERRILPYLSKPKWNPALESDQVLFRGMLLTPEELDKILKEGFSPKTSTWNVGTDGRNAVSFSSNSSEAESYIFQSGHKTDGIGVLFIVKRTPKIVLGTDLKLNPTKTIYYSYEDVPAQDIIEVRFHIGKGGIPYSLPNILLNAKKGSLTPNTLWVHQFDSLF